MSSAAVTFRTKYDVDSCSHYIGVIGSVTPLGLWNPRDCLCMSEESPGNWRGTVSLPVGKEFEWKLVLLEESPRNMRGVRRWEECDNRKTTLNDSSGVVDIVVPWCACELITYIRKHEAYSEQGNCHSDKEDTRKANSYLGDDLTTKVPKLKTNFANNYFFRNTVDGVVKQLKRKNAIRRKKSLRGDENVSLPMKTQEEIPSYSRDNTKKSVTFPSIVVTDVITYDTSSEQAETNDIHVHTHNNDYSDHCRFEENATVQIIENETIALENRITTNDAKFSVTQSHENEYGKNPHSEFSKNNKVIDDKIYANKEHSGCRTKRNILDKDLVDTDTLDTSNTVTVTSYSRQIESDTFNRRENEDRRETETDTLHRGKIEKDILERLQIGTDTSKKGQIEADISDREKEHKHKLKTAFVYGTAVTVLAASGFVCYKYLST